MNIYNTQAPIELTDIYTFMITTFWSSWYLSPFSRLKRKQRTESWRTLLRTTKLVCSRVSGPCTLAQGPCVATTQGHEATRRHTFGCIESTADSGYLFSLFLLFWVLLSLGSFSCKVKNSQVKIKRCPCVCKNQWSPKTGLIEELWHWQLVPRGMTRQSVMWSASLSSFCWPGSSASTPFFSGFPAPQGVGRAPKMDFRPTWVQSLALLCACWVTLDKWLNLSELCGRSG